jgi:hypothetical protein
MGGMVFMGGIVSRGGRAIGWVSQSQPTSGPVFPKPDFPPPRTAVSDY